MRKPVLWLIRNQLSLEEKRVRYSEEARKVGFEVREIFEPDVVGLEVSENKLTVRLKKNHTTNEVASLPDAAFTITSDRFFAPIATELMSQLELVGVPMVNTTQAKERAGNKWWTHQYLAMNKIETPKTFYVLKGNDYLETLAVELGYPLVLKGVYGARGEAVWLCHSKSELQEKVAKLHPDREVIIQEYLAASHGRDVRVVIVDGVIVGTMLRTAANGGFHANLGAEGSGEPLQLDKKNQELAIKAAKALDLTFAGVDLLFKSDNELVVGEVNANPGLGIEKIVGCNVAGEVMKTLWLKLR